MQKETNDVVFKELEYSMAHPNASQIDHSPNKSLVSNNKLLKSPPLMQILDVTLQDVSAKRMSVSTPDPVNDRIEQKQSCFDVSDKLNRSMLIGVLESQARQLA